MRHDPHAALVDAETRLASLRRAREDELRALARPPWHGIGAVAFLVPFALALTAGHAWRVDDRTETERARLARQKGEDAVTAESLRCHAESLAQTSELAACRHDGSFPGSGEPSCPCVLGDPLCACP